MHAFNADMPHNPKTYDGATRPDEMPAMFAEQLS